jgi:hypothetical protein
MNPSSLIAESLIRESSNPRITGIRFSAAATVVAAVLLAFGGATRANAPRFFADDPIRVDPETEDASAMRPQPISHQYDFIENSFLGAGERVDRRAMNVNTVGEVPDSSWFTNRIGGQPWTPAQCAQGPDTIDGPAPGAWTVVSAKSEGITPGMTIQDSTGEIYFIKFDPPANPEMASGAEVISTKFFHAAGYHVPENYLATLDPSRLTFAETAIITDENNERRPMEARDLARVLAKAAKRADGTYRVLASRRLPGTEVGRFRYHGTRPDDPNDIFPHEHRRELRGLFVLAAWLNHDDSRSVNTFDTLVRAGARSIVRHHLIDFGSTLGSGSTQAQTPRAGNEYIWEARPTLITMLTLGFYVRPWVRVQYPDYPAIGRFESLYFRPEAWKPEYPNPAFLNARPEDLFWGARLVAAFTEDHVRAIVGAARYSDPAAADYLVDTLLTRRSKILSRWLNGTNPVVNPRLDPSGALAFENAAYEAAVADPATHYTIAWSAFDNDSGTHRAAGEQQVEGPRAQVPPALLEERPPFIAARLRAFHPDHPGWAQPLDLYFRRVPDGWALVGLERNP